MCPSRALSLAGWLFLPSLLPGRCSPTCDTRRLNNLTLKDTHANGPQAQVHVDFLCAHLGELRRQSSADTNLEGLFCDGFCLIRGPLPAGLLGPPSPYSSESHWQFVEDASAHVIPKQDPTAPTEVLLFVDGYQIQLFKMGDQKEGYFHVAMMLMSLSL